MKTLKVSEFISECNNSGIDVDVTDDYTGELYVAYCGDPAFGLTEAGKQEFAEVLDLDIKWNEEEAFAILLLNQLPDGEDDRLLRLSRKFFVGAAGYIPEKEYDRLFTE